MKTVLFIPGFYEGLKDRDYRGVIRVIESKGYKVKFVPINWARTTLHDWVKEFTATYSQYDAKNVVLAGFSFGAMTAFVSASKRNPSELWLFSLSPYFAEDASGWKKSWHNLLGHRRMSAFKEYKFNELAKNIRCQTLIFVGEAEAKKFPGLANRVRMAHKLLTASKLVIVPNSPHDVGDPNYIQAISKNI
jgi:pimeloyl-ACP methyl ester carboxylesterase